MSSNSAQTPAQKRPYTKNKFFLSGLPTPSTPSNPNSSSLLPPVEIASTQPRLRAPKQNDFQKADYILGLITNDFSSFGKFLITAFHNHLRGLEHEDDDPRSLQHKHIIASFLTRKSDVKMIDVIELIYSHKQSWPSAKSKQVHERKLMFSGSTDPKKVHYARPALSSWALQLVGNSAHREIVKLSRKDSDEPDNGYHAQLRASTNGRAQHPGHVATWEDLGKLNMADLSDHLRERAPVSWYLTEAMAGPRKNGVVVLRKRRPHTIIQNGAISSMVLSQNQYANGLLAMNMAVWQFACKTHVDQKRVWTRFGYSVHDTTTRRMLNSLGESSLSALRLSVAEGLAQKEMRWCIVLDNVQQYCPQHEQRLGREDTLKVGTAATAILLEDFEPGAFDSKDHLDRVEKKDRLGLTTQKLWDDIDWVHDHEVQALHWTRAIVSYIPELAHLSTEISAMFRSDKIAIHRMREGRKTTVQPLGTNAERETETKGMMNAVLDFEGQMGVDEKSLEGQLIFIRGDGASVAAIQRIKKYLCAHTSDYKSFRTRASPGPEVWHTRSTNLNSVASNHYGPPASDDPSSLSKSATAAGVKRPANMKKVDFYPTARSITLFFEARVLDCWRIHYDVDDLLTYFSELPTVQLEGITVDGLRDIARVLVRRYASEEAYQQALSSDEANVAVDTMKVPPGTPWVAPAQKQHSAAPARATSPADDLDLEEDESELQAEANDEPKDIEDGQGSPLPGEEGQAQSVEEEEGFDGDRVLANEILFLRDAGWWVEAAYAVPEGDIGRVYATMKKWIFTFAGTTNRNYVNYLLEMYCLLRYESSNAMRLGILNNLLVNLVGKPGQWKEGDLNQEHYNRWLEDQIQLKGGDFDDKFFRRTLSPNVMNFLRIKESIESAFDLHSRSKTHTSQHRRNEFQRLLTMYKEDQLHLFRAGRSMGHIAANHLDIGFRRLGEGRLDDFLVQSTAYSDIIADARHSRRASDSSDIRPDTTSGEMRQTLHDAIEHSDHTTSTFVVQNTVTQESTENSDTEHDTEDPPETSSDSNSSSDSDSSSESSESSSRTAADIEEEGEDNSNDHLVSGSDKAVYIDERTGEIVMDAIEDDEMFEEGGDSEVEDEFEVDGLVSSDSDVGYSSDEEE